MSFLSNLKQGKNGSKKSKKRKGCGPGSGLGKTCGRGHKGGKARSGYSVQPDFEGGQMPLSKKLPKRGFNNYEFAINYALVNLEDLEKLTESEITMELLKEKNLVRNKAKLLKVLARGELTRKITVKANKFSKLAKEKIEAAGGKVEEVVKVAAPAE